ncbi:MAG TPA: hypothetical protein VGQ30_01105 [Gemmatimonadaceae bacterium]|nr:hypothetical protein [Gemmatimonadaceae bacterium]
MTRIDVGSVLRHSANLPFSDLVTRPTGAAVRKCIQTELAALSEGDVALLDFSQIGMMDYSCADEVVAKLLIALAGQEAHAGYIVFHGITDAHLEAIEVVLEHHGLALVVQFADGGARLVGAVTEQERSIWESVYSRGSNGSAPAPANERDPAETARVLESLLHRRLLRHDGVAYAPLGPVQ